MSLHYITSVLPSLPTIIWPFSTKTKPLHSIPDLINKDSKIKAAKQETKAWSVPVYWIDIFEQKQIAICKALFSQKAYGAIGTLNDKDPEGNIIFSIASNQYTFSLESYLVDKCLSISIDIRHFSNLLSFLKIREDKIEEERLIDKDLLDLSAQGYLLRNEQYDPSHHTVILFMDRVLKRLLFQEQVNAYRQLDLPSLSDENLKKLEKSIQEGKDRGFCLTSTKCKITPRNDLLYLKDLNPEEQSVYEDYLNKLITIRNQRVISTLEKNYNKDQQARERNPYAPLTHLITLESYEKEIQSKRLQLVLKIAAIALGIFFLKNVFRLV